MKVYTSYFANWRKFPIGCEAVGITRFMPPYWKHPNWENLAPSKELLRQYRDGNIDEFIFRIKYFDELKQRKITPKMVVNELKKFNKDIVLCCYEKPGDFCHRHLLAEWLKDEIAVTELGQ